MVNIRSESDSTHAACCIVQLFVFVSVCSLLKLVKSVCVYKHAAARFMASISKDCLYNKAVSLKNGFFMRVIVYVYVLLSAENRACISPCTGKIEKNAMSFGVMRLRA